MIAPRQLLRWAPTLAFAVMPAVAQTIPGDPAAGRVLAERDCVACHQSRFGDTATIYTRAERRVRNLDQLQAQVRLCNLQLKTNYFPDEEEHVAAYLNAQYYRFTP